MEPFEIFIDMLSSILNYYFKGLILVAPEGSEKYNEFLPGWIESEQKVILEGYANESPVSTSRLFREYFIVNVIDSVLNLVGDEINVPYRVYVIMDEFNMLSSESTITYSFRFGLCRVHTH